MLDQSEMMNHSQLISIGKPIPALSQSQSQSQQIMNNQNSQMKMTMKMNRLINQNTGMMMNLNNNNRGGGYGMWQPPQVDQFMSKNQNTKPSGYIPCRNNKNRRNSTSFLIRSGGYNPNPNPNCNPPTVNELHQQQNRLKPRRFISKKKFNYSCKSAPFAPRNTTSFLIRAKKSGGITSLVSPCPVTPAVLPTPVFSPSSEVLVDMAKEEWGVDGYGSMKGLIRLRSFSNEDEESGSSESDVEEHLEVERRLDHDLSRFEMVNPNFGGSDHNSYLLENRVDDQDTHIAQLEEQNLVLKERLFFMEREFRNLRTRLHCLETRTRGFEVVENGSEDESGSRGYGRSIDENSEVLEENKIRVSVDDKDSGNGGEKCGVAADVCVENGVWKIEEKMNVVIENDDDDVNLIAAKGCVNQ